MALEARTLALEKSSATRASTWPPIILNGGYSLLELKCVPRAHISALPSSCSPLLCHLAASVDLPRWSVFPAEAAGGEEAFSPNCCLLSVWSSASLVTSALAYLSHKRMRLASIPIGFLPREFQSVWISKQLDKLR